MVIKFLDASSSLDTRYLRKSDMHPQSFGLYLRCTTFTMGLSQARVKLFQSWLRERLNLLFQRSMAIKWTRYVELRL